MSAKDHIKSLARDLTSLEINTIRRASITGENMPDPRHALYDVALEYNDVLNQLLVGDKREVEGPLATLRCRFTQPYYERGQTGRVEVELKNPDGSPRPNEAVTLLVMPAPALTSRVENDKPRLAMQRGESRATTTATTNEKGLAWATFATEKDDRPTVAVIVQAAGLTTEMHIPLRWVRGDLLAFHYLNHRANEAGPTQRDWLKRRIELNSIRMASMLERLDANDYSRRHLNGDAETEAGPRQEKPPPLKLSPMDLVAVRKIWELGCEEILMQTVVQLDGDVVTRLTEGASTEESSLIHRLHTDCVRVAIQSWQNLVESLSSFARTFFG